MARSESRGLAWGAGAVALAVAALAAVLVWRGQAGPEGPVEPAWDATPCARCRMLVGDPHFAAQLHTGSGEVLFFDDPGCALLYADEHPDASDRLWFHDVQRDRWLPGDDTRFLLVEPTPMGYGLGAVSAEAPGTLSREQALSHARERDAARGRR